jgi:hypothetical protein
MSTFVANERYKSNRLPLTRQETAADRRVAALAVQAHVSTCRFATIWQHRTVVKLSRTCCCLRGTAVGRLPRSGRRGAAVCQHQTAFSAAESSRWQSDVLCLSGASARPEGDTPRISGSRGACAIRTCAVRLAPLPDIGLISIPVPRHHFER